MTFIPHSRNMVPFRIVKTTSINLTIGEKKIKNIILKNTKKIKIVGSVIFTWFFFYGGWLADLGEPEVMGDASWDLHGGLEITNSSKKQLRTEWKVSSKLSPTRMQSTWFRALLPCGVLIFHKLGVIFGSIMEPPQRSIPRLKTIT